MVCYPRTLVSESIDRRRDKHNVSQQTVCRPSVGPHSFKVKGSFGLFLMRWTPKYVVYPLNYLVFVSFSLATKLELTPSQFILQVIDKTRETNSSSPSRRIQQDFISSNPKNKRFLHEICHHVCGISLVGSFHPLGP